MHQHTLPARLGRRLAGGRRGLAVLAGVLACAAGSLAAGPAAQAGTSARAGLPPNSALNGVSAVSTADAWVVGTQAIPNGVTQSLIERWGGKSWAKVPSPNPGGISADTTLLGVSALSATSAWAVGSYVNNAGGTQSLIEQWNGKHWRQVPSPSPGGNTGVTVLFAVSASSAGGVWAVGYSRTSVSAPNRSLIERWNGKSWAQVPSPSPGGTTGLTSLSGVDAVSAADAWAVGTYRTSASQPYQSLIERWNGKSWAQVPSPNPGGVSNTLSAVSADSATDAWAVGSLLSRKGSIQLISKSLILHWNGKSWAQVTSPNPHPNGNDVNGVTALSGTDAWAVGVTSNGAGAQGGGSSVTARWDGKSWVHVPSPQPAGLRGLTWLQSVSALSADNAWAAGFARTINGSGQEANRTLVMHWNGTSWTRIPSPN